MILSLSFPDRMEARLRRLQALARLGDLLDVARKALSVYDFLMHAVLQDGDSLWLKKPDGTFVAVDLLDEEQAIQMELEALG